ncbi:unnamed protein product [Caenorhabditis sp. 36 PRJEB53466]|nr:unnamed protein product [Caenorhabditis sp. 36 PRJEB53466]
MPLNLSRFKKFPELVKVVSLAASLSLLIYLGTIKFRPPGISLIWFTIGCSIVFDTCTTAVLLKEYDISVMAIRMLPYSAIECVGSSLAVICYVISTALAISSEEVTDDFGFLVVALICLVIAVVYTVNFVINVRRWNNGSHHENPSGVYEYTSYGTDE